MRAYRVHPYLEGADSGTPGHPLYIVRESQGHGRIDNPEMYDVLYVAGSTVAAVAEAFGNVQDWGDDLFLGPPRLPGSVMGLTEFEVTDSVVDLDDAHELVSLSIRPSRVVTRNRSHSQAWARAIYELRGDGGVRWWSYHDPDWFSLGLWRIDNVRVIATTILTVDHPAVIQAGSVLHRLPLGRIG